MFSFTDFSHCSSKSPYPQVWKNCHWSFLEYWSYYKQIKNLIYSLICYLCEFSLEKELYLISVTEYWLNIAPGTQTLKGDRRKVWSCNYLCHRSCCQSCQFPLWCLSPYRYIMSDELSFCCHAMNFLGVIWQPYRAYYINKCISRALCSYPSIWWANRNIHPCPQNMCSCCPAVPAVWRMQKQ